MLAYLSTETFLNVSVQRSTGNLIWNLTWNRTFREQCKKKVICGRDKSNDTVDTINSVLVGKAQKGRRGSKANKGTKGQRHKAPGTEDCRVYYMSQYTTYLPFYVPK